MRIAIVTDIHEDFEMLEKAFNKIKGDGYDMLVCLGDITGFAPKFYSHVPNANACIDLLRDFADIVLVGNHDLYSTQKLPSYYLQKNIPSNWYELTLTERYNISHNNLWLYEEEVAPKLSDTNIQFLKSLREWAVVDYNSKSILFSHFLQPDLAGVARWFPYMIGELRPHFKFMEENNSILSFVGHGHPEGFTILNKLFWSAPIVDPVQVKQRQRIVICPALVNSTRKSGYLLFNTKSNIIVPHFFN